MNDFYKQFNEKQYEAITADENTPTLVVAGAGSGKTSVLTFRIVYLLKECNYNSERILGFTFTNKAANEMKERIKKVIPDKKFQFVGTFHSICLRILREDIKELDNPKFTSSFAIIDDDDQNSLLKEIYKLKEFDKQVLPYKNVLSWISKLKSDDIYDPTEVFEWLSFLDNTYDGKKKKDMFAIIYAYYLQFLANSNLLDFDDLIKYTRKILKKEHVRLKWQNRFDYILVDEFQDTSLDQFEIIKQLSKEKKSVFVVGDPDQMIYSWRGATENIFKLFTQEFNNSKTVVLEKNYRSTKKILKLANNLISFNKNRISKNLFTDSNFSSEVFYFSGDDQDHESNFVISKINELVNKKQYKYSDIAILYRANYVSRNIEEKLAFRHIPYRIFGGFKFYQRREVKDILAYLKVIYNSDEISLSRIYNWPRRAISEQTFFKIKNYGINNNISTFAAFGQADRIEDLPQRSANAAISFFNLISEIREKKFSSITKLVDEIIEKTDYLKMMIDEGDENRIENINELKNAILDFEKNNANPNLAFYLQEIALLTSDENNNKNIDSVSLMTVHSAKGLEFKIVFIIQFNDSVFPSQRAIEEGNLDEERRIAYVAITRAREHLYITYSSGSTFYGNKSFERTPSRFLIEIQDSISNSVIQTVKNDKENQNNQNVDIDNGDIDFSVYAKSGIKPINGKYFNPESDTTIRDEEISYLNKKKIEYYIGDYILHAFYGYGVVVNVEDRNMTVSFSTPSFGTRTIIKNHIAVRKVVD